MTIYERFCIYYNGYNYMSTDIYNLMALKMSQLTICNERDVKDNESLVEELFHIESVNGVHSDDISRFVAIVVHTAPKPGHESAMNRYGMGGRRDGKLYLHNWLRVPIAMWDLVVDNINFLVIGPSSFKNHSNNSYLVKRMISNRIEFLKSNDVWTPELFETSPPVRLPMDSVVPLSMEEHLENLIQQSLHYDKLDEQRRERLRDLQRLHDLQCARERGEPKM